MKIRYINKTDDLYSISRIYEESWKYAYKDILPREFLESISKGHWNTFLRNEAIETLLLESENEIIGTLSFSESRFKEYWGSGEIISLYLLPEYMGKGYGKNLLLTALKFLKEKGFSDIFLYVLEENKRAIKFYEQMGFQVAGDYLEGTIGGKQVKELRYKKQL